MALVGHRVQELLLPNAARFDAHLLPGDSTSVLRDEISVRFTEIHDDGPPRERIRNVANATAPPNPAVTMVFSAGFAGSDAAPHHALGVTWDPATGTARADAVLPAPLDRVQNFAMRAVATARNGAETTTAEIGARVHVHDRLTRIWLTPNPLTLRRGCSAFVRLTVLGEFDDGVVADLTQFERTVPAWGPRFAWTSSDDTVARVGPGGRIEGLSAGPADITCTISQPGGRPDASATATVNVVAPWGSGAEVRLVAGDAGRRADVPNVLFIAEGCERDDEDAFDRIVANLVDRLGKNHLIDPWPWVSKSVNFWSVFTPAREPGMTRHSEVWVEDPDQDPRRPYGLPQPKRPADNADRWSVAEMLNMVGLPVPGDADTGLVEMLPRLQARFGPQVTEARIEGSFPKWIKYASRRFVDDVDSAFYLARGARTRFSVPDGTDTSIFEFDERRMNDRDLQEYLGGLRHGGNTIGAVLWGRNGKDRGLVCMLTRSNGRSVAGDDFFVCSLARRTFDEVEDAPDSRIRLSPIELPDPEFEDVDWLTYLFAHECGHAFGLGDEYGESDIDAKSVFARTDDDEAPAIERFPNLAAMATLRTGTNEIDANRVKWSQWLRITDAAVVVGAPTVAGAEATVEIRDGQAQRFKDGDSVRLRKRLCRRNAENDLAYRAFTMSQLLAVTAVPDATHVRVRADGAPAAGETALGDLTVVYAAGEGTILFKPTRQVMPGAPQGREVPVMSPLLTSHLSTKDRPLNVSGDDPYTCKIDHRAEQPPRNLPVLPTNKPCYEPLIIGLYDGGRRNHCGTFHPGGVCMMRDQHANTKHRRFCTVCRYVLVDMIDPTQHKELDRVYAKEYPH